MSGIVGSRFNIKGSGLVGSLGTDGQVFTSSGTGTGHVFEDAGGGITEADQWRLHTSRTFTGTSNEVITANLERTDVVPEGKMGTGMSESSGIFTFPSTGYWWVLFNAKFQNQEQRSRFLQIMIESTVDNSTYVERSQTSASMANVWGAAASYMQVPADVILDVTDVANIKVRFSGTVADNGGTMKFYGGSTEMHTYMTFIKLGDT